ncbi:hypothetical protein [Dankookia sp. P2]|uniref:hypothetical protein n=1 Tax=Dankookia sp. P2 TaxID=3423955 RepID=UPI003D671055
MLLEAQVFVGEGEAAIRAHFADHALIAALGLRSIVNVPVLLGGVCRGTVNFLWPAAAITPGRRAMAGLLGLVVAADWAVHVQ